MKKRLLSVLAVLVLLLTASLTVEAIPVNGGVVAETSQDLTPSEKYKKVKFKNITQTIKSKKIKTKDYQYNIIKKSGGGGVTAKIKGIAKSYIAVSSAGSVTVKKRTAKGTYKIKVFVETKGGYEAARTKIMIRVK